MISYYEKYKGTTHFRVDKMEDIEIIDLDCHKEDLDIVEYTKKIFSMYSGEETMRIQFDNSLLGVVIDRFARLNKAEKTNYSLMEGENEKN